MPDSTSSQSPQDAFISSNGTDQWNIEIDRNINRGRTGVEWTAGQGHPVVPISSNMTNRSFLSNEANGSEQMQFTTPPNYINLQHPRHGTHTLNGLSANMGTAPNISTPVMVRTTHSASGNSHIWQSQRNLRLIQTAWNKSSSGGVKKQKRVRTAFTSQQMMELEQEYARTRYLDRSRRLELAELLRLNERTIKIWFQNRRMKEKKDKAENAEEVDDVSTTQPPSEISVPVLIHNQYQNTEAFNRMGIFIEQQYPVSTTSVPMAPMAQVQMTPGSYPACVGAQYNQVHVQDPYIPSLYSEVHELSPESTVQSECSVSIDNLQNEAGQRSWDVSWIRSMHADEEC